MEETVVKKRYFRTSNYLVVEEKKTMVCVYLNQIGCRKKLLTSRGIGRVRLNWQDC